ncbi:hypothetical protein BC940DRAFT_305186 [Gongronella butleri]|nr:hypothetical protein BC940DRAFT_305186 [Gongronella butleri]
MATSSLPSKTGLGTLVSKSTILGMLGITTLGTATLFGRSPASQYYMAGSAISAAAFFGKEEKKKGATRKKMKKNRNFRRKGGERKAQMDRIGDEESSRTINSNLGVHKWMVQEDRLPALLFQTTASHGNTPMQHLRLLNNAPPSMSIHSSNPMFVHHHTSAS